MAKIEIQNVIDCQDSQKLNNWAAELCMGWVALDDSRPDTWYSQYQRGCMLAEDWFPASKDEKGKGQCWDLAEKYYCWPRKSRGKYIVFIKNDLSVSEKCPRVAVTKAAIICEILGIRKNKRA